MKKSSLFILLVFLWVLGSVFSIWAVEFSADSYRSFMGKNSTGKVFVKGHLTRMESKEGGQDSIIITDLKKKTTYILNPKDKTYMEMALSGQMAASAADPEFQKDFGTWKDLGTETVNGYLCDKRLFTPKDKSLGMNQSTQWIAREIKYPIKSVTKTAQGDMTMEYKNIKTGNVSDSVFKIPAGYTKMEIPGMGGKGMIPGMGKVPTAPATEDDD
ncbi:MAG: DUF4412 domain-containing protein [Desulfobacteraceae bacterium]|nr:MAG: DUF4412 domain-containing protein [Desulfobacteraceae bacterium]